MKQRFLAFSAAAAAAVGLAGDTFAASFASAVRNTGGTNYEFILNEAATNVTINLGGGGSTNLGALAAGRHTFTAAGAFDIAVASSSAPGYTLTGANSAWNNYESAGSLAINNDPASPFFGTIYVNQGRVSTTIAGRTMGKGIYSITADRVGVNLTDWTVPANANDTTLAKLPPGIGFDPANRNSVYRIGMDDGGNLIIGDFTDSFGGMKVISADLTTGGILLRGEGGLRNSPPMSDDSDAVGLLPLHGSILSEPQVSGTWGVDLSVAAMDEDLDVDYAIDAANDGNSVWRWNIGSTLYDAAHAPSLEIGVGSLTVAGAAAGRDSEGKEVFLSSNGGVQANAHYNAHFNKWYLSGARSDGHDASSLVIATAEGPGGDGKDIIVDWASRQFGIDNGLDGFVDVTAPIAGSSEDLFNDIFRGTVNIAFSPDNTVMYVQRRIVAGENPVLGAASLSGLGTKILAIELDAQGLPVIGIDDGGTPGNTADDKLTGITPIATSGNQGTNPAFSALKVDAAGNLYYVDNSSERLQYLSVGGSYVATTSSAGTFDIEKLASITGDYNGDGLVNAADYTVWRDSLGKSRLTGTIADGDADGLVDSGDHAVWAANYGASAGASGSATIPEPTAALLCLAGLAGLAIRSRG